MTRPPQLALALLGTAITVVVIQSARNVDRFVAAPAAAAYGVQGSDGGASKASRRVGGDPEVLTPERSVAMPVTDARPRGMSGGDSNDVAPEEAVDTPDTEPATVFGIPLPAWLDEMVGRRRSPVAGGTPFGSTESPASPATPTNPSTPASTAGACKHELAPDPQGITAQVEFVGVLLNGEQKEGDTFSGAELDDLKILVEWKSLFQNHRQRVDLIAPDGSLYQSLPRPLTANDNSAPVETLVPVNGTWITRYGLYGSWCVEVFLGEQDAPVTSSRLVIAKPQ
jgi:hypothetical protein